MTYLMGTTQRMQSIAAYQSYNLLVISVPPKKNLTNICHISISEYYEFRCQLKNHNICLLRMESHENQYNHPISTIWVMG